MEEALTHRSFLHKIPWLRVGLVAVTIAAAVLYIWQVNLSSTRGYTMRELQSHISEQKNELERLRIETAKLSSVDSVRSRVSMLGLVKPEQVTYVSAPPTVALK